MDMRHVDQVVGDLHHVFETGAGRGERMFQVLEGLNGLGAEISRSAGHFAVSGPAELSRNIDGTARARGLDDVTIATRRVHGSRILKAMDGHGSFLPGGFRAPP